MVLNNNIKKYILEKFSQFNGENPALRNKKIKQDVKSKFGIDIVTNDIYELCQRDKKLGDKISEINESIKENKSYEVIDGHYIFHRNNDAPFRFSVEEIDGMFLDFSEKGMDLTSEEMIQKYELKPEAWYIIKNRLRLYKKSNVISPYTAENTQEEQLDEKIEFATSRHIDTIKSKMVSTHEKQFKSEAKKAFRTLGNIEYFLGNLREYIEGYVPQQINFTPEKQKNNDVKHFIITDIHIGKINTNEVIARIYKIHNEIINSNESIIYITCLGDLVENLSQDGMHPGQITLGMDHQFGFGFDLLMNTVSIFEKFLISLYKHGKKVIFNGITGNHGRFTGKKEDDVQRTGELVIYELIKRGVSNTGIDITYHIDPINTFSYDNLHFIIAHGDNGFDKKKQEDVLWKHGNNQKHNVVLLGDKHNAKIQETKMATWIQCPALAGQGHYDKSIDVYSEPGYIVIKENEVGTADINIKRLK